ncbi:MAG: CpaF family protein [Lachnospiraceae bacterium]|nr:CpaF family protein [Lachnospiraceae bacterium]
MKNYHDLKQELKEVVLEKIDLSRGCEDNEIQELIDELIIEKGKQTYISLPDKQRLSKELFYAIRKLDMLQELIDDSSVTEIMINGTDSVFVEKDGKLSQWEETFESREKLEDVIQQIVAGCNRVVNEATPIVDARLENGSRVNVVLPPVALNGPILTIRRFPDKPIGMEDLISYGSISQEVADFLQKLVEAKYNILISGGTGSGKTTFLNALSQYIPKSERIISIEDSAELQIQGIKNLVRLETRNANVEDCKEITIRDLIKSSLRMRPDRIIVGEVRGGEAIDMLQCLNTGHDGSLSTAHANSGKDLLARLETMVLMGIELPIVAIQRQIAAGIDIIVHLGRLRDRTRKVLEILEVVGYEQGEIQTKSLYEFEEAEEKGGIILGRLEKREALGHLEKWKAAGIQ